MRANTRVHAVSSLIRLAGINMNKFKSLSLDYEHSQENLELRRQSSKRRCRGRGRKQHQALATWPPACRSGRRRLFSLLSHLQLLISHHFVPSTLNLIACVDVCSLLLTYLIPCICGRGWRTQLWFEEDLGEHRKSFVSRPCINHTPF